MVHSKALVLLFVTVCLLAQIVTWGFSELFSVGLLCLPAVRRRFMVFFKESAVREVLSTFEKLPLFRSF